MILLDKQNYRHVIEPLRAVKVNHLFARAVLDNKVAGHVYADLPESPASFYIVHPYGMSLLFGETTHTDFNRHLLDYLLNTGGLRSRVEWMQTYPESWNNLLSELLGKKLVKYQDQTDDNASANIVENTRVNFRFNTDKYFVFRRRLGRCDGNIVRTDREIFNAMQGAVVPKHFWNNADDFCRNGAGFSIVIGGKPVSTAYSAYISEKQLELGIETSAEFRGKGYAGFTCSALIDYCLENNYEPVWSCRMENSASYLLAQKLGFEPTVTLPYYRLPVFSG
jgi:hypothetical protein